MIASRILLLIGMSLALMGSNCDKVVQGYLNCGNVLYAAKGSEGTAGDLFKVDPATAATTAVGPIGHGLTGLAVAPFPDCTIYGTTATSRTNGELITINPKTGAGTVVGPTDEAGVGNHPSIAGLTFVGGTLYGWSDEGAPASSDDLVTIDTATGAVTVIPSPLTTGSTGLAADSTGTLHVVRFDGDINTIDPATGTPTLVVNSAPWANGDQKAAAFVDGTLFAIDGGSGAGSLSSLVTIDLGTGVVTPIGPLPDSIDSLAYAE